MIFNGLNGIYEKKDRLGNGGCGEVYKVLNRNDNKFYALKGIPKKPNENVNNFIKVCINEINIMKNIKSKYIVKLIENFYVKDYEGYCIVMELCDCDLRQFLNEYYPKGLPLELINKIFLQLNDVLKKMLEKNFIHRDLKPENILIKYTNKNKKNFIIKLTDFGFSTSEIKSSIKSYSKVGTKNYIAPEIENSPNFGTAQYNNKCDLFSLGIILYELYTNKYIFNSSKY